MYSFIFLSDTSVPEVGFSYYGLQLNISNWLLCQKYYCYYGFINYAKDFAEAQKTLVFRQSMTPRSVEVPASLSKNLAKYIY